MIMSPPLPDVLTVRPETITVPALLRSSALAAVPVAAAVADTPEALIVKVSPETEPGVVLRGSVARTPVDPDRADVPITREPAAVPVVEIVGDVAVPNELTTRLSRLVRRPEE
jgi:hypothetical protein